MSPAPRGPPGKEIATATQELAQYFTPPAVAAFAFDALEALGLDGGPHRVVDPACGEGVFLRVARERFPDAELWGCDVDPGLAPAWQRAGLRDGLTHLLVLDGLGDSPLFGLQAGSFSLVVGNPPYGLGLARPASGEPIEAQFVRRFVQLVRPGGWLAVVVPEGIVANARCQALRDWVLERLALEAVVALPETTFASSRTRAHTVLLIARRERPSRQPVLLASPTDAAASLGDYLRDVLATIRSR